MHGPEKTYMDEAYDTNWMSTVGKNINEIESQIADMVGLIQLQRVGAVDFNAHTCCNAFGGDRMLPHPKKP